MSASFEKINYAMRPGKHAARRMLCDVFSRLNPFQPVEDYVYVGFGSVWFEDFILFHRSLGIREMISIERETKARKRIQANLPFANITVHYKEASLVLPRLNWNQRHYVWLDYEDAISQETLLDIQTVTARAMSGSVLVVTVPCKRALEIEAENDDPEGPAAIERFREEFGLERVPPTVSESDLIGWPFGDLTRQMIKAEIISALAVRNGENVGGEIMSFHPICDIEYDDGTPMVTVAGLIATVREFDFVARCGFDRLDFIQSRRKPVRIKVPKLTPREVRYLEQKLPITGNKLDRGAIPYNEARAYAELYRYLPNFAVLES